MSNQAPTFWEGLPTLKKQRTPSMRSSEYDPQSAELEAQAILQRARTEAAEIVSTARTEADLILRSAGSEARTIKSDAAVQGALDGYQRAKQEVEEELHQRWEARVDALTADVQEIIDSISDQRTALWEKTELEVVAFVLEMAKRVVRVEVEQNLGVINENIRHALRRVADKENIRIRVSPDELEHIRADRKDLLLVLDGARQLEIVDDRRIGRGGCVIETNAGTIDARIDTQFEQIADKLGVLGLDDGDTE